MFILMIPAGQCSSRNSLQLANNATCPVLRFVTLQLIYEQSLNLEPSRPSMSSVSSSSADSVSLDSPGELGIVLCE